ncbi:hypothetical protein SAMN05444377_12323 [Flavobacterium fontis]|uniref:Uncharacterized protein n=1 Tax=Flavobacterium fontis TaxID=1124188 RepID=A0A1M5EXR3_9FLAO|nr:hypothetical protein [Flavobacterium fontis]SHF84063.1 hypothetical protein SAMN05444377_12323 [Flavobacterium fontis]
MTKRNYEDEAIKLSKVIDIAIESMRKFPSESWSKETLDHVVNCYKEYKEYAINPEPKFKKIASLKYLIEDVFTRFQESSGKDVEYFWQELKKQNLYYSRKDKLDKIIKSGKIKSRIEFEYVTDIIVLAEQEGRITKDEAMLLGNMLDNFALKHCK